MLTSLYSAEARGISESHPRVISSCHRTRGVCSWQGNDGIRHVNTEPCHGAPCSVTSQTQPSRQFWLTHRHLCRHQAGAGDSGGGMVIKISDDWTSDDGHCDSVATSSGGRNIWRHGARLSWLITTRAPTDNFKTLRQRKYRHCWTVSLKRCFVTHSWNRICMQKYLSNTPLLDF